MYYIKYINLYFIINISNNILKTLHLKHIYVIMKKQIIYQHHIQINEIVYYLLFSHYILSFFITFKHFYYIL